ncbi:alpha/beta fold hydrolase [Streptomyces californicus]|uniref:alpha/beta fold hydrolase n=1 Tax=Streptomyces californicus TaxID=67351 RepID=UPI0036B1DCBB
MGKGPGLLLAHGAGSDIMDSFGPVLERLAEVSTVVGPEFPGSGNQPMPKGPLTLDGIADHVVANAVQAGLESFAISGFSMGTTVAVRAATRHPERVTGLILSSGFARANSRLRLVIDTWRALARNTDDPRTLAAYLSLVVGGPRWLDERTPEEVEEQLALFSAGMPVGADAQLALFDEIDVREDLRAITVPTLIVSPLADLITTPLHSRALADGIPHAESVTLDCGHAIAAERPDEWADAMTKFLTALPPAPGADASR